MPTSPKTPSNRSVHEQITMQSPIGRDFGGCYRVDAELGQGGSGVVYRAWNRKVDRPVALKLLRRDVVGLPQRRRFEREAKALAAVAHPNIVAIFDCGVSDSVPFLAMELLEGQSLADALREEGRFELARAERVLSELLAALAYVHASGLVHRDLKPGNVFLQRLPNGREQVKLLDFGLAKFLEAAAGGDTSTLTRSGEVFGTPAYMPLEQWSGQTVDARADVYAAGVVAFELFAGSKPFPGEGHEVLRRQLTEAAPPLHAMCAQRVGRPELERVLSRALSTQAIDRQRDAGELAAAFRALPHPWLYEGSEVTDERKKLADKAHESVRLATAPTMEQPAFEDVAGATSARGGARADRRSLPARMLGSIRELVRRVVVASAWTLSVVSVLAIALAVLLIFVLRSPERGAQRTAIEGALPSDVRDAVTRGAAAAESAVRGAVSDATKRVGEVLPQAAPGTETKTDPVGATDPAAETDPEAIAEAEAVAEADRELVAPPSRTRPPARDPLRSGVPRDLRALRSTVDGGRRGSDRMLAEVRKYNREHPHDSRGHLLLARLFVNRNAWADVVAQYQLAYSSDAGSRGDPRMLRDLLRAVVRDVSSARAINVIATAYGREALGASQRARANARGDERARLDRLVHVLSP